jgi:1,2-phenylacetyl-CoA epoxidase catalytic subunit
MSLTKEGLLAAIDRGKKLKERVNKLAKQFEHPFNKLDGKVQMNHYGQWYLFGKEISEKTTDREIIEIIEQTPNEEYDGHINFFGEWCIDDCPSVIEKHQRLQARTNLLFYKLDIELEDKVMKDMYGRLYLFGNLINEDMADDELEKIINDTPDDTYDGWTNIKGTWITRDCRANVEKHKRMQKRVNKLFQKLGLIFDKNDGSSFGKKPGEKVYVDGKGPKMLQPYHRNNVPDIRGDNGIWNGRGKGKCK